MTTQIIYDETGYIISIREGSSLREPVGVPFLNVELPENAFPISVNVEGEHFVEYGYHPRNKLDELEEIVSEQEAALIEIAEMLMLLQGGGEE